MTVTQIPDQKIINLLINKQSNKQPAGGHLEISKYLQENVCGSVSMV